MSTSTVDRLQVVIKLQMGPEGDDKIEAGSNVSAIRLCEPNVRVGGELSHTPRDRVSPPAQPG